MNRPISLPAALESRAVATAAYLARALPNAGPWEGYRASEGLSGRLERPTEFGGSLTVSYTRPGHPDAALICGFLEMVDIQEEHRSEPKVIHSNIEERERYSVNIPAGVTETDTLRHTFSRTVTEAEAAKSAWEVAAKASLGVEFSGVKAALEVTGKYGAELSRQVTTSETTEDVVEKTYTLTGPLKAVFEAYRSVDQVSITRTLRCDFDFKLYFQTPGGTSNVWEWSNYWTQFIPLAQGLLSDDIYGYAEFMATPPTDEELAQLTRKSDKLVQFEYPYDAVVTRHFEALD